MATYYVDFVNGLDANNGLGPDASHASNKPWKTITKLLGAAGMASADTAYLSPAGPFREVVTVAMTSAVAETKVYGDPFNAQGFKTSGGVSVTPGPVIHSAYLTDDNTAPSATALLNLAGRDFLTFENIQFQGGTAAVTIDATTTTHATNITFRRCVFQPAANGVDTIKYTGVAGAAANWVIDSCIFNGSNSSSINPVLQLHTADYDINIVIKNCLFQNGNDTHYIIAATGGAGVGEPGGIVVLNCTFVGGLSALYLNSAVFSNTIPSLFYNNVVSVCGYGVYSGAASQLTEDYNVISATIARTNVTTGGNSVSGSTRAITFDGGYSSLHGFLPRQAVVPRAGSTLLGFGNQVTPTPPTTDILNRPRPAGGGATTYGIGAFERHDTAVKETSVVDAGSTACKITGPGDHDIIVPVDASATVLTVRVRYDTNHGTGTKPQAILLANGEIGVTTETVTAAAGVDTYETLSFASQTPTAKGYVTIRLVSRSAAGNGIAYFDTLTGGAGDTAGFDYFLHGELPPGMVKGGGGGAFFIG